MGIYSRYAAGALITVIGFLITLYLTPIIGTIAARLGITNETRTNIKRKINKHDNIERRINPNPVPLLGGLAVLVPFILLLPLTGDLQIATPLLISVSMLAISGYLDDRYNLPALTQLAVQITAAAIVAVSVININIVNIPLGGMLDTSTYLYTNSFLGLNLEFLFPGDLIMILWLLFTINAVKWVGGIDALLESTMLVAFAMIYVLGIRSGNLFVIINSALLLGLLGGFTFFNFPPAKIFTASSGKTAYGFLIGVFAIVNNNKFSASLLILLLPLTDFIFVITKRFLTQRPKDIKETVLLPIKVMRSPDTNHLHHQLLKLGYDPRAVLMIEGAVSLLVGVIAVASASAFRLGLAMLLAVGLLIAIVILHYKVHRLPSKQTRSEPEESPESRYSY